jgi:serine/threonine protein kinase
MDCNSILCTKKARQSKTCPHCQMRSYCSEACRDLDWESLHKSQCNTSPFSLCDFARVPGCSSLGKGAYGEVQLIKHRSSSELFALKEIQKVTKTHKIPLKMLFSELSIHSRLSHPNIIRLYGHCESMDKVSLFLEYADGGSLFTALLKKPHVTERQACSYFSQICEAVRYLHENDVIHRDLKPENILLTKKGTVKVCDFGWSAIGEGDRKTYCGTLDYMAPEILNETRYNNKVDIWSLGVILYEILQGTVPYKGKTQFERARMIMKGDLAFSSSLSYAAKILIRKMLEVNPEKRIGIEEVMNDEWLLRYQFSAVSGLNSPKISRALQVETEEDRDEFDLKLTKNYPSAYKRSTGFTSKMNMVKSQEANVAMIHGAGKDANSNEPKMFENKSDEREVMKRDESIKKNESDLNRKKEELMQLQNKLEGSRKSVKKKTVFLKILNTFGFN